MADSSWPEGTVEVIPSRLVFLCLDSHDQIQRVHHRGVPKTLTYSPDHELLYEPFFADFGPLNMGLTYRFCHRVKAMLQTAASLEQPAVVYTTRQQHHKANAALLVGIYQLLYLDRTAEEAYDSVAHLQPFAPFRDASCGVSTFHLTVRDCLQGIEKAVKTGLLQWFKPDSSWSLEEYEFYDQVEHGDMNWIVPGKLLSFSGPRNTRLQYHSFQSLVPEDYWNYFKRQSITGVVRLNRKMYDRRRFLSGGFNHYELYFPDGSCPPDSISRQFMDIVEREPGALAVHCKAGLGRTGTLICCYLMKHLRFTAREAIAYIRICRPGSVIGPQQHYLEETQDRWWREGERYRQRPSTAADAVVPCAAPLLSKSPSLRRAASYSPSEAARAPPPAVARAPSVPTPQALAATPSASAGVLARAASDGYRLPSTAAGSAGPSDGMRAGGSGSGLGPGGSTSFFSRSSQWWLGSSSSRGMGSKGSWSMATGRRATAPCSSGADGSAKMAGHGADGSSGRGLFGSSDRLHSGGGGGGAAGVGSLRKPGLGSQSIDSDTSVAVWSGSAKRGSGSIARTLAPNGQPRKMPLAKVSGPGGSAGALRSGIFSVPRSTK